MYTYTIYPLHMYNTRSICSNAVTKTPPPYPFQIVGSTIVTPVGWNKRGRPSTKSRPMLHTLTTTATTSTTKLTSDTSKGLAISASLSSIMGLGAPTATGTQANGKSGVISVNGNKLSTPITTSILLSTSEVVTDSQAALRGISWLLVHFIIFNSCLAHIGKVALLPTLGTKSEP